jgi:hypothetical protein
MNFDRNSQIFPIAAVDPKKAGKSSFQHALVGVDCLSITVSTEIELDCHQIRRGESLPASL